MRTQTITTTNKPPNTTANNGNNNATQVLDMCAAPGSKTFQLLEMLHAGSRHGEAPPGIVVANDADAQRCNLLTHQTKRMCSPCLLVTNHEGQMFPRVRDRAAAAGAAAGAAEGGDEGGEEQQQQEDGSGGEEQQEDGEGGQQEGRGQGAPLLFDRILADVPCSGDGTMRKAPDIWARWSPSNGNGLHLLQLRIALQGARLLKVKSAVWRFATLLLAHGPSLRLISTALVVSAAVNNADANNTTHRTHQHNAQHTNTSTHQHTNTTQVGGRMVYSTCTFNPIEDEAVVAELLIRCGGSLRLVDVDGQLPALKRVPGLKTWRVRFAPDLGGLLYLEDAACLLLLVAGGRSEIEQTRIDAQPLPLSLTNALTQTPTTTTTTTTTTTQVRDKHQWYDDWDAARVVGHKLSPSMFCTPEKAALPLGRCMRFLPHHNDTGGFFVAVLEKVAPLAPLPDVDAGALRAARALSGARAADAGAAEAAAEELRRQAAAAAEYALEAAARAVGAVGALDAAAAAAASDSVAAALARISALQEIGMANHGAAAAGGRGRGERGRGRGRGGRGGRGGGGGEGAPEAAAAAMEVDGEAAAAAEDGAEEQPKQAEADPGDEQQGQDQEEQPAAAAARPDVPPGCFPSAGGGWWRPSWVRGCSSRAQRDGEGADGEGGAERKRRRNNYCRGIDPVYPIEDPHVIKMVGDFYGVEPSFPLATHLITRCLDNELPKRLYYVSGGLLRLLAADEREQLRITATGLKVFERHELKERAPAAAEGDGGGEDGGGAEGGADGGGSGGGANGGGGLVRTCHYRPVQEGLPFILPHITRQVLDMGADDFKLLLRERNLALLPPADAAGAGAADAPATGEEGAAGEEQQKQKQQQQADKEEEGGGEQQEQQQKAKQPRPRPQLSAACQGPLAAVAPGGCVARLDPSEAARLGLGGGGGALAAAAPLAICAWRTRASLSVLVTRAECDEMLERVEAAERKLRGEAPALPGAEAAAAAAAEAAAAVEAKKEEPALVAA